MSALAKKQLKLAREAIGVKNWSAARAAAEGALNFEADNYNAHVFLALALLNLESAEESEQHYKNAIELQPDTVLAYQGYLKLLEQTEQWSKFEDVSLRLNDLFYKLDDAHKAAEVLQKLLPIVRSHRQRADLKKMLRLLLPESHLYPLLSTLPAPDPTAPLASGMHDIQLAMTNNMSILDELINMQEADEFATVAQETDKRRMRLTGPALSAEQSRRAVQADLLPTSTLPGLYAAVLDHPHASDFARVVAESKLLWHNCTLLLSLPKEHKHELRLKVQEQAKGMVLIRSPEIRAWEIVLDWQDVDSVAEYDDFMLKQLLHVHSSETPLHQMTLAHLVFRKLLPAKRGEEGKEEIVDAEDLIQTYIDQSSTSLFSLIVAADFYVAQQDWINVRSLAEGALKLLNSIQADTGLSLDRTHRMVSTWLASALVYQDAPAHHRRALKILSEVLAADPANSDCLIGKGRVLSASEQWQDALVAFDAVPQLEDEDLQLEVRSDRAWCLIGLGRLSDAMAELETVIEAVESKEESWAGEKRAKLWWRLGRCLWEMDGEYRVEEQHAYTAFINALKLCPTYAPAFTSLGLFYMDVLSPADTEHGVKCFQKALELDPSEDTAARRLAEEFATREEWDIVEAVSRRVLGALPGRNALESGVPLPSHTTQRYSWAWKAVGLSDFKVGKHAQAIQGLQHALRGNPSNVGTLLWLGISYHASGKHIAALKTFGRVVQLDAQNWVAHHLAAEIQRSIGLLQPAINNLEHALSLQPEEAGITVVLAETKLAFARQLLRQGQRNQSLVTFIESLKIVADILSGESGQKLAAKVASDATFELSQLLGQQSQDPAVDQQLAEILLRLIDFLSKMELDSKVTGLSDSFSLANSAEQLSAGSSSKTACKHLAVLFAKMKLLLEPSDSFTLATAWSDLGTLLFKCSRFSTSAEQNQKAAVRCLREALKRHPRNPHFWTTLGVLSFELSPRLCQHAFIRSAEYDSRSAIPWTNLGIFYLQHQDYQLANKAFLKAQVIDPDWPHVWLGQACLAALHGDERERRVLVSHSWMLAAGSLPQADLEYAQLPFEPTMPFYEAPTISSALHAITRYCNSHPQKGSSAFLHGVLAEKDISWQTATASFASAASAYELAYEATKAEQAAAHYVDAKLGEGRAACANDQADIAEQASSTALELIADSTESTARASQILAHLQLGLSSWYKDDAAAAIQHFEESSQKAGGEPSPFRTRAGLMLARCLANLGGDEGLQEAKNQLLSFIADAETGEPNLEVVTTLAALAIVQRDDELLTAAIQEIINMSIEKREAADPSGEVDHLLVSHHLLRNEVEAAKLVLAKALHRRPQDTSVKLRLARLLLDSNSQVEAASLLELGQETLDPEFEADWSLLSARAAQAQGRVDDARRLAQRAAHLQPHLSSDADCRELSGL